MSQQSQTLHVDGMHCKACVYLIQDTLCELDGIENAKVSLKGQTIKIIHNMWDISSEELSAIINPLLHPHGYLTHSERQIKKINRWEYVLAAIMAGTLIFGFVELQQLWLLQMLNVENRTFGTSFLIGLIASISSCLAVVWGVVLALWTVYSQNKSFLPHSLFHIGRLVWFFILGGLLWLLGSLFQLSQNVSIVLNMVIAIVLFILGLNLLGLTRGWVAFGGWMFKHFSGKTHSYLWPVLIGIGTFFLPCGFTQSMQIYTLSTGSFLVWGLTMLSFALGTFPVLILLSITGKSLQKSSSSDLFFKTIGIILVVLALYNFASSFVAFGVIPPFFSF